MRDDSRPTTTQAAKSMVVLMIGLLFGVMAIMGVSKPADALSLSLNLHAGGLPLVGNVGANVHVSLLEPQPTLSAQVALGSTTGSSSASPSSSPSPLLSLTATPAAPTDVTTAPAAPLSIIPSVVTPSADTTGAPNTTSGATTAPASTPKAVPVSTVSTAAPASLPAAVASNASHSATPKQSAKPSVLGFLLPKNPNFLPGIGDDGNDTTFRTVVIVLVSIAVVILLLSFTSVGSRFIHFKPTKSE